MKQMSNSRNQKINTEKKTDLRFNKSKSAINEIENKVKTEAQQIQIWFFLKLTK